MLKLHKNNEFSKALHETPKAIRPSAEDSIGPAYSVLQTVNVTDITIASNFQM